MTTEYPTLIGVNIDNYIIPFEEAPTYLANRDYWRQYLINYFKPFFHSVSSDFKGSQDGEAIVAVNDNNELQILLHLDPYYLKELDEARDNNQLEQYLQNYLI